MPAGRAASATLPPPRPALQQVDRQQQHERGDQHQRGDHRRAGIVELFELDDDQQRRISVTPGMLPAMNITEPYSPMARAKASVKPVSNAGNSGGSTTRARMRARPAPSSAAASSSSAVEFAQYRLHRAHDKWQAHEQQRHEDARAA